MAKITSVIDIGSNSVRLAIFQRTSQFGFSLLFEFKSKVRISEKSYENRGFIQEKPMERTICVLKQFHKIAKDYKSKKILCVATSAVRDAPNKNEFIKKVFTSSGLKVKVLDGKKEAFYAGVACANLCHKKDGIVVDIGGGSTECTLIENGKIQDIVSLNLGTIRLKELFLDKRADKKSIRSFILKEFQKVPKNFKHPNILGVGGTIRCLAKLFMKQNNFGSQIIHGFEMSVKKVLPLIEKIINQREDRLHELGISAYRSDSIQGGLLIFLSLLELFESKEIIACGVGIKEGVFLADCLRNHSCSFPNGINPSLRFIKDSLRRSRMNEVSKNFLRIFFEILEEDFSLRPSHLVFLEIAMDLLELGVSTDFYHNKKHASYRAKYMLNYGYSHQDRGLVALLLEFSDKKLPKEFDLISNFQDPVTLPTIQILSFILAISRLFGLLGGKEVQVEYNLGEVKIFGLKNNFLLKEKISKLSIPKNLSLFLE